MVLSGLDWSRFRAGSFLCDEHVAVQLGNLHFVSLQLLNPSHETVVPCFVYITDTEDAYVRCNSPPNMLKAASASDIVSGK